ncbi:unnamed protein product [Thlaspi arvense]|uniref:TITAN-like protein n=1 Tax=Thlaspi arvense TaxID=13288 RepID=A0AAU9T1E1_THLAR|nr:unnamed protein product [Thlaspi arvense]
MEAKKKTKSPRKTEIEFCEVCRLHHDQGSRHKYFPRHKASLSAFLDRFRSKLADVRFFLKNPIVLRPEEQSQNRVWCVFCDEDIVELGSSFACSKAINHLASPDHHKNIKRFLWKYGPGMDCIDDFLISEADVAKWGKKCKAMRNKEASSCKGSCGQLSETSNDIHNKLEFETMDRIENFPAHHINDVMPLLYNTNEYQISHSELPGVTHLNVDASHLPLSADPLRNLPGVAGTTSISSSHSSDANGNVHSGAPPPWLNANDGNIQSEISKKMPVKTCKLNPNRVGAAWAERRKMEMEMEKKGHAMDSNTDADWLPNFGRVWQSGTRKESRKEFDKEKRKLVKTESISMESEPVQIQPYISKRMRKEKSDE